MQLALLVLLYSMSMAGTNLLLKLTSNAQGWKWWALFVAANAVGFSCVVIMPYALKLAPSNIVYALCIGIGFSLLQLSAWIIFRESLTPLQWGGVAFVSVGLVLLQWKS